MNQQYRIIFSEQAKKDLARLDRLIARRIFKKLHFFEKQVDPLKFAEPLQIPFLGKYKFRIGHYRVIFRIESDEVLNILFILSVDHRKDSYR